MERETRELRPGHRALWSRMTGRPPARPALGGDGRLARARLPWGAHECASHTDFIGKTILSLQNLKSS